MRRAPGDSASSRKLSLPAHAPGTSGQLDRQSQGRGEGGGRGSPAAKGGSSAGLRVRHACCPTADGRWPGPLPLSMSRLGEEAENVEMTEKTANRGSPRTPRRGETSSPGGGGWPGGRGPSSGPRTSFPASAAPPDASRSPSGRPAPPPGPKGPFCPRPRWFCPLLASLPLVPSQRHKDVTARRNASRGRRPGACDVHHTAHAPRILPS